MSSYYKGWHIARFGPRLMSADRLGVRLAAASRSELERVIDTRQRNDLNNEHARLCTLADPTPAQLRRLAQVRTAIEYLRIN